MREIKFRVWCHNKSEYEKHPVLLAPDGRLFHCSSTGELLPSPARQDTHTVEWYTGLKDKNGKEIFEGDRVLVGKQGTYEEGTGVFIWADWVAWNGWMNTKAGWSLETKCRQIWTPKTIEVIGTIHDGEKATSDEVRGCENCANLDCMESGMNEPCITCQRAGHFYLWTPEVRKQDPDDYIKDKLVHEGRLREMQMDEADEGGRA